MTTLVFELFGRYESASHAFDEVGRSSEGAGRKVRQLGKDADEANSPLSRVQSVMQDVTRSALQSAAAVGRSAVQVGELGSAALSMAPLVAKAGQWVFSIGQAALQASPALLALGAGALFVKLTMQQIGPAIGKALEPVTTGFTNAGAAASLLAVKGVRPLAAEFAKVGTPIIAAGMNRIAVATNGVVTRMLQWAKSTAGVTALRNVITATSGAVEQLGPHISRVVESLGNMIGRIAGVSMAAGAGGLSAVLDKLSGWMDKVNAASVQGGLDTLHQRFDQVRDAITKVVGWVKTAIQFWQEHRTAITAVQDAIAVLTIAFGGLPFAIIAAVGLIVRHWNDLKAAWQSVTQFFTGSQVNLGFLDNLRVAAQTVLPPLQAAFQQIRAAVWPVLQEIWTKIKNDLIPAFGQFIAAIAPVVAFMIGVLGPVVATVWASVGQIISGAISVITGILQVFTGLLTGNWRTAWEGVKNIVSGIWEIIKAVIGGALGAIMGIIGGDFAAIGNIIGGAMRFVGGIISSAWNGIVGAVGGAIGAVVGLAGSIGGRILGAIGNLGSLLYNAGRNVIQGLINGIVSMIGAIGNAVGWVASKIRAALPFSPAKEGPLSGSGSPDLAGRKIPSMIARGMLGGLGDITAAAYRLAGSAGLALPQYAPLGAVGASAARGLAAAPVTLQLSSDGSEFAEGIVQVLRKAVRGQGGNVQVVLGR